MKERYFSIDLLPEEARQHIDPNCSFSYTLITGRPEDVEIGDEVGVLTYHYYIADVFKFASTSIKAESNGVNVYNKVSKIHFGDLLYTTYTREEYLEYFKNAYEIYYDSFLKEKSFRWTKLNHFVYWAKCFCLSEAIHNTSITLLYEEGKTIMAVKYWKSYVKPKAKDQVLLLFDDDITLSFQILKPSHTARSGYSGDSYKEFDLLLTKEDIDVMCSHNLLKLKIVFRSGEPPFLDSNDYGSEEIAHMLFKQYAIDYRNALNECGVNWEERDPEVVEASNESCYVYLMVDTTNGYYKIGISNKPEYREGTLQSEKPTIELLCAKKFPSRTIAKAFESALHSTYESKHLRGEWFQLDARDIIELTETLK